MVAFQRLSTATALVSTCMLCLGFHSLTYGDDPSGERLTDARSVFVDDAPLTPIDQEFQLADGAAWDGAGQLFVPDVKAETVLRFNLRQPGQAPRAIVKDRAISGTCYQLGKLFLSDNRGSQIAVWTPDGKTETVAQFAPNQRPNDLTVDPSGNIYVTFTGEGVVRKITPDGNASVFADKLITPNGIALSPDGMSLYVSSAKSGQIYQIDVPDRHADRPQLARRFAQLPETKDGFRGDGMCVDRAGNLYVTGAESVFVFDPNGTPIDSLTPPERPINVILGGIDGRRLFLSTFGGLYRTAVRGYGVAPNPPMRNDTKPDPISTNIPESIDAQLNVVYANVRGRKLLMDVFRLKQGPKTRPGIIVVHGGGWLNGDKTKFRALALRLAQRGYVTAAIEYRLGFEAHFPAGIRDCNAATVFLRKNAGRYGIDPKRIAAVGGSAGGHLVGLMAAGTGHSGLMHGSGETADASLKAIAVLAGPFQTATGSVAERATRRGTKSNAIAWLGGTITEKPKRYQLADVMEKISPSMPPTLFITGSKDNPERNQPSRQRMNELGVVNQLVIHPDARHGHWNRAEWILRVVDDLDAFFGQHL